MVAPGQESQGCGGAWQDGCREQPARLGPAGADEGEQGADEEVGAGDADLGTATGFV